MIQGATVVGELEERCVCVMAEASLVLEWHDVVATVAPAPGRRELGVLDVSLAGGDEPAIALRVVVSRELTLGAFNEASAMIVRAVRRARAAAPGKV